MSKDLTDEEFEAAIKKLATRSKSAMQKRKDESKTIHSVILPFIDALGFDTFNDEEVVPEFNADVGTRTREKVDYALKVDGKPIILVEVKASTSSLNASHQSQLFRYFTTTDVKIGILTNGIEAQFYSDLNKANVMDDKPFLKYNFQSPDDYGINFLKLFRKKKFSLKKILEHVQILQNADDIKKYIRENLMIPDDDFLHYIAKAVMGRRAKKGEIPNFHTMIRTAFAELLDEGDSLKQTILSSHYVAEEAPKRRRREKPSSDDGDDEIEKLLQKYRSAVKVVGADIEEHEKTNGFSYSIGNNSNRFATIDKHGDKIRVYVLLSGHSHLHGFTPCEITGTANFYADVNIANGESSLQEILSGVKKAYDAMSY